MFSSFPGALRRLTAVLVSIAVPAEKAWAVVDAMEHDMGTTLATKSDLESQRSASRQDIELLRKDMENGFTRLDQKIDSVKAQLELKIDAQEFRMTVKLGSITLAAAGLIIAVLRACP